MSERRPVTTTDAGIPASSDEHSLTVGPDGPILLQDHYLVQKMAQFNRERVPERVVHAKGGGAHGYFEANGEAAQWCRAEFLAKGVRTPVFARFSTVAGELGSADTARDPRGFALKFYTSQGNYDMVGNNTPVFFIRDPQKFQDFIHSQKRRADTHLRDNNMQWDFWTLSPESAHQVTWLMGDRGTPRTWRHMNGYSSHTFMWVNAGGERFWVKYHFKTDQGVECFTDAEAKAMSSEDPDLHIRDLREAIERGELGRLTLGSVVVPYLRPQSYYESAAWRGTWELDGGGALMNQAIHNVDLLYWLMGDVAAVTAMTATLAHQRIEVEDTAVAALRFHNGALGTIEAATSAFPGLLKRTEVHGDRGSARVEQDDITLWEFQEKVPHDNDVFAAMAGRSNFKAGASDPRGITHAGHRDQLQDFLQAIDENRAPLVDGREGRKSVEIIRAIYRSAQTGATVALPLEE